MTALVCLLSANTVRSSVDGARLIGLAMHQEVGRNIYIGAIHYNSLIPVPIDIVGAAGPKTMEYRVVARRTSIRSLIGSILLQGELATGKPPSNNAIEFAGDLMSAVKGSLYEGDSLTISLNSRNTLIAALNGQQLARSDNRDVADYLLMGWVSERGPSQAFRRSILSQSIDSSLRSAYDKQAASTERIAAVQSWNMPVVLSEPLTESTEEPMVAAVLEQHIAANEEAKWPNSQVVQALAPLNAIASDINEFVTERPNSSVLPGTEANYLSKSIPAAELTAAEPVQFASLTLTREMMSSESDATATWDAIDAIEYTQRLAAFNNQVMRSVYAKIRYPKSAVRKNVQGKLELDLTVAKDGTLLSVTVALTSGSQLLDKSAIRAANSAFSSTVIEGIDSVSVAEYGDAAGDTLLIPVPISYVLTD
jgi:TonB family protein